MSLAGNYYDGDKSSASPGGVLLGFATSTATIYAVNRSRQAPKLLIYIWWKIWVRLLPLPPYLVKGPAKLKLRLIRHLNYASDTVDRRYSRLDISITEE